MNNWIFFLGWIPATVAHEMGHALIGWIVGLSPRVVSMGVGPIIWRRRFGRTTWVVRALPIGGFVMALPLLSRRPVAYLLFVCGGALGNVSAAFCLVGLAANVPALSAPIGTLAIAQAFMAVANLTPFRSERIPSGASDGLHIFRLLCGRSVTRPWNLMEAFRERQMPLECRNEIAREIIFQYCRWDAATERWARRDRVAAMRRLRREHQLSEDAQSFAFDILISAELTFRDTGVTRDELDQWSIGMVSSQPENLTARITRGGVLAALGRPVEAEKWLRHILDKSMSPAEAFACRAFLAETAAQRG